MGDGKQQVESYYDYAKKVNSKTDIISEEELELKRNRAQELQKEIEKGGWISE